jgi:predicted permease
MSYISIWWAFWILSSIFGQIILRITLKSNTVDDYIFTTICSMIQNIVNIPLALLAIQVIKNYAKLEPHLFELKEEEKVKNEVQTLGGEGDVQ